MSNRKDYLIILASGGMELAWIIAIFTIIFSLGGWPLLPLVELIGIFWLAVIITSATKGKGWRIITILIIHLTGLIIAIWRLISIYSSWETLYFGEEWFLLSIIILSGLTLWWTGIALARREITYNRLCNRFDSGIAIFFFLLVIGVGIEFTSQIVNLLIVSFIFNGILAIALVVNKNNGQKSYLVGYRGKGLILTFAVLVLIIGGAATTFFLPYLTMAAETGYFVIRAAGEPIVPYLLKIILFFFRYGSGSRAEEASGGSDGTADGVVDFVGVSGKGSLLENIIGLGFISLVSLLVVIFLCWGLWRLFHLILRPTSIDSEQESLLSRLLAWVSRIQAAVIELWQKLRQNLLESDKKRGSEVEKLYRHLVKWGKASGVTPKPWETPAEYGKRLSVSFPKLKGEIEQLIDCYNQEIYGEIKAVKANLIIVKKAWRSILSPLNWPARMKIRWTMFGGKE